MSAPKASVWDVEIEELTGKAGESQKSKVEPARQEGQQGAEGCRGKLLCAWHDGSASMRNALHISKSAP